MSKPNLAKNRLFVYDNGQLGSFHQDELPKLTALTWELFLIKVHYIYIIRFIWIGHLSGCLIPCAVVLVINFLL